jgi:HlyD family secretion protein
MKGWRKLALIAVLLAIMGVAYTAYARSPWRGQVAVKPQTFLVRRGTLTTTVSATGSVVATNAAKLGFPVNGKVAEVLVQVGDSVAQGQPLATLDPTDLALQVTQAQAKVASASAALTLIKQGARPEEIAAAEASLTSAQAGLANAQAGPTRADLEAAQASVAAAKANLTAAQTSLSSLQSQPKPDDVKAAQLKLEQAKDSLWSVQVSRDGTCHSGKEYQCAAANQQVAAAEADLKSAQANLDKISQPASAEELKAAQDAVASAQAAYDSAVAKLQQVQAGSTAAEISAAKAAVSAAEQQLAQKRTPYTEADIQSAQAAVDEAKAALALAQHNLDGATLVAPFAGVVSAVAMNPGESSAGGTVTLVDPKALRIDATLDESEIAKLALGQEAAITFDALTGRNFRGKVIAIAPSGTSSAGVVTYLVSLSIEETDGLKAGMTANASIVTSSKENVLLVPNRALQMQGRERVVNVLVGGKPEVRVVRVGVSNDQYTEITDGLNEGDEVLVGGTTTTSPRVNTGGLIIGGGVLGGGPPGGMGR